MSNDFTRHAHRKAVWAEIQRVILQRFIAQAGGPPKELLICEEAFYSDKEVSQEAIFEVLEEIQRRESMEQLAMLQFEFRRRDVERPTEAQEKAIQPEEVDEEGRKPKSYAKSVRGSAFTRSRG